MKLVPDGFSRVTRTFRSSRSTSVVRESSAEPKCLFELVYVRAFTGRRAEAQEHHHSC